MTNFVSRFLFAYIEAVRLIDHSWRRFTGSSFRRYSYIAPHLFVGGQYTRVGLSTLKKWGVTAIVSMRSRQSFDITKLGWAKFLHLPIPDKTPPSLEQLDKGVQFIKDEIASGGSVYVHCFWGEGRGPTMAAAYLSTTGLTVDDAFKLIKKARPFIRPTDEQVARVREFAARHQTKTL